MYERIKHFAYTVFYLILWLDWGFRLGDPVAAGLPADSPSALPIYESWRLAIDWLYYVSYWLWMPIHYAISLVPQIQNNWFPYIVGASLVQSIQAWASQTPSLPSFVVDFIRSPAMLGLMPGAFYWQPILAVLMLKLLSPVVDIAYDAIKNVFWTLAIELSFTKRKEKVYQKALSDRSQQLQRLNVDYRNLSKEASQLKSSVITDELTQVYNKRFFLQKIQEEFNTAKKRRTRFALIMMDIDHFKKLNDTYGHMMGDKVLKVVAGVVKDFTPKDCFCCRFGGEEFGVIMPGFTPEDAQAVADAIRDAVPTKKFPDQPEIKVTISQGLCAVDFNKPEAQANLPDHDELIKLADNELYRAKIEGRNRVCSSSLG